MKIKVSNVNTPNWKDVNVKSHIPAELEKLSELAHNIWWAWNYEATELFRDLDPALWKEVGQNPVLLLERMSYAKLEALANDKVILRRMEDVYSKFRTYMDVEPDKKRPSVAYFSMEYGLSHVLKIYSGGLGVLAGDYLKEASDSNADLCAIGFLYRYGYFTQTLSMDGQQIANYEAQNFGQLPIDRVLDEKGEQMVVDVPYLDYYVHAYVWRVNVGRISLYLLDTDNEMNSEFDRSITHQLYGGDWENRLKQEILLGIGGILTLKKLGIKKDIYHCNEGHAALINVQRICDYVAEGLTYDQAIELVRASSLYTVHTPVPAGHDYFDEGLFGKYMGGYTTVVGMVNGMIKELGITVPVALHLDHGSYEAAKECIEKGFSSVMFDGSKYDIEENVAKTKEIVALAHAKGVSVEAEVGAIGGEEDGVLGGGEIADPDECASICELGVDMLAAGIGNIHGVYPENWPGLRLDVLAKIQEKTGTMPLVLHGGTGIPDEMVKDAISKGVSKINVNTECQIVFTEATRKYFEENKDQQPKGFDPRKVLKPGFEAIKAKVKEKMELFGSINKA